MLAGLSLRVLSLSLLLAGTASAQSGPPQGIYACHVHFRGDLKLTRNIKIWRNGNYEHLPTGAGIGSGDWGQPGHGTMILAADGAPIFRGGPLEGSQIADYSFDGKQSRFLLQGPVDPRASACFGPAYFKELK